MAAESSLKRIAADGHVREAAGLVSIVVALLFAGALASYRVDDPSWFQPGEAGTGLNWFGWTGATLAEAALQAFGTAAILLPIGCFLVGLFALADLGPPVRSGRLVAHLVTGAALCALLDLLYGAIGYGGETFAAGGFVGHGLAGALRAAFNTSGAVLVSLTALAATLILTTRLSLRRSLHFTSTATRDGLRAAGARLEHEIDRFRVAWRRRAEKPPAPEVRTPSPPVRPVAEPPPPPAVEIAPPPKPIPVEPPAGPASPKRARGRDPRQGSFPISPGERGYTLPPLELLNEPAPQTVESEHTLVERGRLIADKLREFSVHGSVVAIHPGPVVTTFEFKPEAGVKYSKITGMTDDLSLALRAESVRIDRMAGQATVAIEVPNRHQETIYPRELIGSDTFSRSESKLTMALGKDISGQVTTASLEKMPHLLIAGATGAGKSVGLNGMIASILFKATPDDVRFIMIDTKMIELGIYADIPHLLIPVVTEAKHAATALRWAVKEMEQRYRKLAAVGVRNIAQFNDLLEREPDRTMPDPKGGEPLSLSPLSLIVIVIDELADLMMVTGNEVEEAIMRLAQMARAVGIHLIIATQRPSVDVITGTIKANFPSRIAFRVSQRVDSRTIIDQQGAEHLLGRGDMLFLANGSARLKRVHGSYLTEAEINRITEYIKRMADPVYDESVLKDDDPNGIGTEDGDEPADEFYRQAVRTVIEEGKCSITLIQRRLKLGYARAARIVDMMERQGVVSPGEGSKPREILVGTEYLDGESGAASESEAG